MKIAVLALSVSLLAASAAAHADPTSDIPNLTDIAIDGGGNVISMDQTNAFTYCQSLRDRLPTIRELALWATQYGAKISDTPQNGYDKIWGADPAGNPDTFYYQHSGYKAPAGDFGQYWYWSLSVFPGLPHDTYAYGLFGHDGGLGIYNLSTWEVNAVRCVQSH